ncbi:MAG: DUF7504 family protein [Candidatus Hecatellaceae archaeon]
MPAKKFGIRLIDDLLFEEPENLGSILILGDGGSGKSTLCKQFAYEGLKNGEACIYVAIDESPEEIIAGMRRFNWNVDEYLEDETFKVLSIAPAELSNINALNLKLTESFARLGKNRSGRVIIDSLTALCSTLDRPTVIIDFIRLLGRKVKSLGSICFYTLNRQGFDSRLIELVKDVSDGVIELKLEEEQGRLRPYLRIFKMKGINHSKKWVPYTIDRYYGLRFYVPRVLLVGPKGAGKRTLVERLAGEWKPQFRVSVGELELEVVLGGDKTSLTRQLISSDISGVIVMADSADPFGLPEAVNMLQELYNPSTPTIFLANKQDLKDAITPQNIRDEFNIPEGVKIVGTVALTGEGLEEALKTMLKLIIKVPV